MKRTFLICISMMFIFSCFSCTRQELPYISEEAPKTLDTDVVQVYSYDPTDDGLENVRFPEVYITNAGLYYSDGELYFRSSDMYYKYNKETGDFLPFCKDPVCDHRTLECPFYGNTFSCFYIHDENIIYLQDTPDLEHISGSNTLNIYDVEKDKRRILHYYDSDSNMMSSNMTFYKDELLFTDIVKDEKTEEYIYSLCAVNLKTGKKRILLSEAWMIAALMSDDGGVYYTDLKEQKNIYAKNNDLKDTEELPFYNTRFFFVGDKVIYVDNNGYLTSSDRYGNNKKSLGISDIDSFFVTDKYIYYRHNGTTNIGKTIEQTGRGEKIEQTMELNVNSIYRCNHDGSNIEEVIKFYDGEPLEAGESVYYSQRMFILSGYYYTKYDRLIMGEDGYLVSDTGDKKFNNYLRINIETGEKYIIKVPNIYVNH
ncbi:MAG: hypothetical protein E7665_04600 [Ruminococcaceae bacterium]|nr:hypothetical protein [Oscillospiraceae bacterium]